MNQLFVLSFLLWLLVAVILIWSTRKLQTTFRWVIVAITLALMPLSWLIYQQVRTPVSIPLVTQKAPQVTAADIDQMIAGLEQRLEVDKQDTEGLKMLARSYRVKGKYQQSIDRYHQVLALAPADTTVMLSLIEVMMIRDDGQIQPAASYWIQQVLSLQPMQPQALWLAGLEAQQQNDVEQALGYWKTLLPLLDGQAQQQQLATLISQLEQKK